MVPGSAPDDLAGLDTGGADLHLPRGAATGRGAHRLNVGVPTAVGPPVRVGHVVAEARSLAADVAHASHGDLLGCLQSWSGTDPLCGSGSRRHRPPEWWATRQGYLIGPRDTQSARSGAHRWGITLLTVRLCRVPDSVDAAAVRRW